MRNKKLMASLAVFILLVGIIVVRYVAKPQQQYSASFLDVFNTSTTVVGYAKSEDAFRKDVSAVKEKLDYYHKLYDIYHSYSGITNLKDVNEQAKNGPVEVSQEIIDLLLLSKEMYAKTDGQMNIAMGSVLKIWHDHREAAERNPENASLPTMEELEEAAKHTDINNLIIDTEAKTVYFADSEMSLDVGSIGKGYAVEQVALYAKELGIEQILFSVGGNIRAVGTKADGQTWRVGIQNPDKESESSYVLRVGLQDLSLVTSGDYQRYYEVDGIRYCHIIDPDTLMPANEFASVTILCADSGMADALSTSLFCMSLEEGMELVQFLEGVEALWLYHDGRQASSPGFEAYILK